MSDAALSDTKEMEERSNREPGLDPAAGIALSRSGESSVLGLAGAIDISRAAELKAALVEALGNSRRIEISAAGVTDLDVTALQLLWAARRAAAQEKKDFVVTGEPERAMASRLAELGMEQLEIFA
jgi:anti-anti-sigma regulatory factor